MNISFGMVLQVLILTTGIYLVLGFLRTTRGSGMVRGLAVALLLGVVVLWGITKIFDLEELDHIIQQITGYVAVIIVILFQPELRRGITHLGENPLVGRLLKARRQEVVTEVAQAMIKMAKKRQGAIVAFERKIALDAFIERAVKIDAEVNRFLLDSIFHHGSALHDGAIILRGDRIAAASCLFPLTENIEISKSTGTRHRASLGLTEETDAVTVAVSEETGFISICKAGKMERNVSPTKLEETLRARIGSDEVAGAAVQSDPKDGQKGLTGWLRRMCTESLGLKFGAFAMAFALYWGAHQEITLDHSHVLRVAEAEEGAVPTPGQMLIVLPAEQNFHRVEPADGDVLEVEVTGTRSQLDKLIGGFGGVLRVSPDIEPGAREFPLEDVAWSSGALGDEVGIHWKSAPTRLEVAVQFRKKRYTLTHEHVVVDSADLSPRYQAFAEGVHITPTSVEIEGPLGLIDDLDTGELPLLLAPIKLFASDVSDREEYIGLDPDLVNQGFSLAGRDTVMVQVEISPAEHFLEVQIEKEIALVWRSLERESQVDLWKRPSQKARFGIRTVGILQETDPTSAAWLEQTTALTHFVKDNLWVYVDVSELVEGGGSQLKVRFEMKQRWQDAFDDEMGAGDDKAELVPVLESDEYILLIPREP